MSLVFIPLVLCRSTDQGGQRAGRDLSPRRTQPEHDRAGSAARRRQERSFRGGRDRWPEGHTGRCTHWKRADIPFRVGGWGLVGGKEGRAKDIHGRKQRNDNCFAIGVTLRTWRTGKRRLDFCYCKKQDGADIVNWEATA